IKVHPAVELFPTMGADDLKSLAEDIKANGQRQPVVFFLTHAGTQLLLDGRNRLSALELAGESTDTEGKIVKEGEVYPYAYVVSANIHRRHLTIEQRRELIERLLKERPELSDRAVAKLALSSDKTVASRRRAANAEIPHSDLARVEATG